MEVLSQPVRKSFRTKNLSQPAKHINNDISMNSSILLFSCIYFIITLSLLVRLYRKVKNHIFTLLQSNFEKSLKTGNFRLFLIVTILKQLVKVHFSSKLTKNVFLGKVKMEFTLKAKIGIMAVTDKNLYWVYQSNTPPVF